MRRFSPACAGNSSPDRIRRTRIPVQPRVRGELKNSTHRLGSSIGSAPRARGTPVSRISRCTSRRFSPACAGNSLMRLSRHRSATVQPRVRGELDFPGCQTATEDGSAPRARGTRGAVTYYKAVRRFSPACAGNSLWATMLTGDSSVQPRVRGELYNVHLCDGPLGGSAPRARGTRRRWCTTA